MKNRRVNFAQFLSQGLETQPESRVHAHVPEERADAFTAFDGGAAELEVLNFLNALVYLFKPRHLLETGTGPGLTTIALASALQANGFGILRTVESEPHVSSAAQRRLEAFSPDIASRVSFQIGDSRGFIEAWEGPPFDFAFFDSLIAFRHIEFQMLLERRLLGSGALCLFHDTSRLRGRYNSDFNPEMISALDEVSLGRQWLECDLSRGLRLLRL